MLKQPIIEKLAAMRLLGMVEALKAQEQDPSARELSFLERLGLLVDQQWNWRENQALSRRLKNAKLRTANACVEEIDYRTARGLDKSVIRSLTQQSVWVGTHENVFVLGPTGVGKSFVACALAQKACRDGYSALYTRAQSLFRDLAMARADGSLRSLLARLSRIDVLVIDDWAIPHCQNPSAAISWRSAKTAIKCARRSSPRNCRSLAGTSRSAIRRWPMASSTGWSTTHTASRCVAIQCAKVAGSQTHSAVAPHIYLVQRRQNTMNFR
jgi:DNA replication protein DnaC